MNVTSTDIPGVLVFEPEICADDRGSFFESFNESVFRAVVGAAVRFVQDNHSTSRRHVLRGLHWQDPRPQGKLVRAIRGRVYDVAADIRPGSPTFGQWVGVELSAENRRQLWIPPEFAHGYLAVEDAEVLYKTTDFYAPEHEHCIAWDDPTLAINWPLTATPILSWRDRQAARLEGRKA